MAGLLGGFMADRLARRTTMVLAMTASAAAMLHQALYFFLRGCWNLSLRD